MSPEQRAKESDAVLSLAYMTPDGSGGVDDVIETAAVVYEPVTEASIREATKALGEDIIRLLRNAGVLPSLDHKNTPPSEEQE